MLTPIQRAMHRGITAAAMAMAAVLGAWPQYGETFDPLLAENELPLEVVASCADAAAADGCTADRAFTSRWVGRSQRGNLFLVLQAPCVRGDCHGWLIEKGERGAAVLLALSGEFHVERTAGAYPVVLARQVLNDTQSQHSRFEWRDGRYVRAESRLVYRVDGVECGEPDQCAAAAREALRRDEVERALKIYERVHGVSWI